MLLRFKDLRAYGVNNHPTLARWIKHADFPPGFQLGPNTRAWHKSDCDAWLANRPTGPVRKPPEIVKPGPSGATKGTGPNQVIQAPPSIPDSAPTAQVHQLEDALW
jgi:predicted DNA-binding transcriptional regulator AlpA